LLIALYLTGGEGAVPVENQGFDKALISS